MSFLWSLLGLVLSLGILVTLHEWGHYIVGRLFNIKVEKFSIGFGRPIWMRQWGETQFQVAAIPLGGYVKFTDEREGPVDEADLPRAFNRQPVWKRFLVVLAGPVVNIIFAWLAFALVYGLGVAQLKPLIELPKADYQPWEVVALDAQPVQSWTQFQRLFLQKILNDEEASRDHALMVKAFNRSQYLEVNLTPPKTTHMPIQDASAVLKQWFEANGIKIYRPPIPAVISQVMPDSPAQIAGLQPGDQVVAIDGKPIQQWQALVQWISEHPGVTATFTVLRQGKKIPIKVKLGKKVVKGHATGFMGVAVQVSADQLKPYLVKTSYNVWESLKLGIEKSLSLTVLTGQMIQRMLVGEVGTESLSGPIGIAQVAGQALQSGVISFISFLAVLSLSLGLLNLLPIPVLDGGHLFMYLIEMLRGRPLSDSVQQAAQMVGLFLILSLTLFAIFNDLSKLFDS